MEIISSRENSKRKLELFFTVFGILLMVWLLWSVYIKEDSEYNPEEAGKNLVTPKIEQIDDIKKADFVIPLNGQIEIKDTYTATYPNSQVKQTTTSFISSKNRKENFDFYLKWAEENSWKVVNSQEGENISSIYLKKGGEIINIVIEEKIVTISHVAQ